MKRMNKVNTKASKRIAAIILTVAAAFSLMGCSMEVTTTETHTDADGNTTTITTETDENGTTTTTTETDEDGTTTTTTTSDAEDDFAVFEKVPIEFTNEMGWDVVELTLKMASSDEWSSNFLGDDVYLNDGGTIDGLNVTYNEDDKWLDIHVADSEGEGVTFEGIELPTEDVNGITFLFGYDEENDSYTVEVIH